MIVVAPSALGGDVVAVLKARGIEARTTPEPSSGDEAIMAWALAEPPDLATASAIAAAQSVSEPPLLLLCPPLRKAGRGTVDRAAAASYLRSFGVAIFDDPDAWIEAIVLVAVHGAPRGSRVAIVAEPGTWLEAAALALDSEGTRPPLSSLLTSIEPTDAVLIDARQAPPTTAVPALVVPVCPRAELATSTRWLHGVQAAARATSITGQAVERAALGRGPAPRTAAAELEIDRPRLDRQLGKIGRFERRLGDHESKVLLAAYGVPITRQAVAATPSAAVALAKRVGYPVDIKPWASDLPSERDGCPLEASLDTAAGVRRAFSAVLTGRTEPEPAVIVRESPPPGRLLSARIEPLPCVGLTVIVEAPGQPPPPRRRRCGWRTRWPWPACWWPAARASLNQTVWRWPTSCAAPPTSWPTTKRAFAPWSCRASSSGPAEIARSSSTPRSSSRADGPGLGVWLCRQAWRTTPR
ncbi:MAG: acetate--CoA ligase family protein [Myxococcales bacterium]|nr:acetate--CoA ligase family protein [Myxococcales bacterium]